MRQIEQPQVQKLKAKRPKLMPYKSSSRTTQAGDVESQELQLVSTSKTLIRLQSIRHLCSRPPHMH